MLIKIKALLALLLLVLPAAVAAQPAPHVRVELIAEYASVAPGDQFDVLFQQAIDPGWHTYWRNPGDSGDPPKITWQAPPGVTVSDFSWPYPERIAYGPLMNFGYHDSVSLPFTVTVDPAYADDEIVLSGSGRLLVCADICIPEKVSVRLTLPIGQSEENRAAAPLFRRARAMLPVPLDVETSVSRRDEALLLNIRLPLMASNRVSDIAYFPFAREVIDNYRQQAFVFSPEGLTLTLTPGFAYGETTDLSGVLVITEQAGQKLTTAYEINAGDALPARAEAAGMSLLTAVLFALMGGVILNLMPCVFPVLSIKVLSLAQSRTEKSGAMILHGLVYAAGVVLSFIGIATLLIVLRAAGEAIGWGFQLQSPLVVGLLFYLFVLIGLNLLGVFEIGTSVMSLGAAGGSGYPGSFMTGVLATIVAAPCTAPFMGAAVGFALTQSSLVALIIFGALGTGMALPYLALTASPGLLAKMPRPGPWMIVLRQALAFPMFASAIWLLWVLGVQAGVDGMMQVLAGGLVIAFGAWLLQQTGTGSGGRKLVTLVTLLLVLVAIYIVVRQEPIATADADRGSEQEATWSAAAVQDALRQGPVFVNFTAAWCITCKVNELNALKVESVRSAFMQRGVTYFKADWTNEDAAITAALQQHGRSGVPLYLLYSRPGDAPVILPQLLTPGIVLDAIKELPAD